MHPSFLPSKLSFFITFISFFLFSPPNYVFANSFLSCSLRFSCGDIKDIGYPFWGLNRTESCGDSHPGFKLNCNENALEITIMSATYKVLELNTSLHTLRVARTDYSDNICPTHLINSTFENEPFQFNEETRNIRVYYDCQLPTGPENLTSIRQNSNEFECPNTIGYYVTRNFARTAIGDFLGSCADSVIIPVPISQVRLLEENRDSNALEEALRFGLQLRWSSNDSLCSSCINEGGQCGHNSTNSGEFMCYFCPEGEVCSRMSPGSKSKLNLNRIIGLPVAVIVLVSIACFTVLRFKGKSMSNHPSQGKINYNARIEAFITKFGSFAPNRYSYGEIKKMTNRFKDKLGEGGFGSVYKGKLPDGRLVAVKVLSETKGNGEDFMNEVASISRTSHVNIVCLLGFCFGSSKTALIYEFLSHGSLDKFIYSQGSDTQSRQLDWKTLYDIALGIARGLEYLHQGCSTRILHFDIKPHNILLDEDFCPKIADFGLSKLCERKESVISMTGARGTAGYIAPEVFSRNLGGVSHKSDVYSYGMMVLEMIGGRRNIEAEASQTSEIYYPSWIYKHLDQCMNLNLNEEIKKKLIAVSLCCIQTNPVDRPSITKVLEMLQGSLQSLILPPRPP